MSGPCVEPSHWTAASDFTTHEFRLRHRSSSSAVCGRKNHRPPRHVVVKKPCISRCCARTLNAKDPLFSSHSTNEVPQQPRPVENAVTPGLEHVCQQGSLLHLPGTKECESKYRHAPSMSVTDNRSRAGTALADDGLMSNWALGAADQPTAFADLVEHDQTLMQGECQQ